jgi:hypothetical protein
MEASFSLSLSPPRETLPPFSDIVRQQMGITVGVCKPNGTQAVTGPLAGLPQQPYLTLVSPNSRGRSIVPILMDLTHLPEISQVPLSSSAVVAATAMTAGSSSSSTEKIAPLPEKVHFGAFLRVSSRCMSGAAWWLYDFCFSCLCS